MRKLSIIGAAVLMAACAFAEPNLQVVDITLGALTGGTGTLSNVSGYLEDIQVLCTDGASAGSVFIAVLRPDSTVAAVNIATNTVTDELLFRPVVDGTDILGAALTSDPPRRMYLYGETLRFIVIESPTNKVWRMRVKTVTE